ncbi:MAG: AlpA family transcriptional regulator [Bacteroidetes bacterium]|nr:AlpA family transcriptional regulator [Bacteroidota bacterium]
MINDGLILEKKERILRLADVKLITSLSRSTIYRLIAKELFPKPRHLGLRSVGWLESEIDTWVNTREECPSP